MSAPTLPTARRRPPPPAYAGALAARFAPPPAAHPTPGALAAATNTKTVQTPALDLVDDALVWAATTPDARLIVTMPPQEGKSVRAAQDFPTWLLTRDRGTRIVVASYGQTLATRNGREIRRRITTNPGLGLAIAADNGAVTDWALRGGGGGVLSVGIGGGLTGRPADALVIDDPIKDQGEADSITFRDRVWDWWQSTASTRLAPGAPVIVILTRWHEDDLAGRLLASEDKAAWRVLNIPAQADHRPDEGQSDPLGREPGEFMLSARGRTTANWERRKRTSGSRVWAALFQGRPAPAGGGLFPADGWDGGTDQPLRYAEALWVERADGSAYVPGVDGYDAELIASWDLAFKDTGGSDYVVGQVWLRRGVDCYLLDQSRARRDFVDTLAAFRQLSARWPQAVLKLVEDKANGPAVIAALRRSVPGIVPEEPLGSKTARAAAVTPLVEAGQVHLPTAALAPWVADLIEEAQAFPNGAHDDQVDALTQALNRLILIPLIGAGEGEILTEEDLFGEGDATAYLRD